MKISVFGPGYVGLVTAAGFAEMGNTVLGVGRRQEQVDALNKGEVPIYEPGLEEMILRNHKQGRLRFTTDAPLAIRQAACIFICVGTPPDADGGSDLSAVYRVAESIGLHMNDYKVVINKSTVPVGTGDAVREIIQDQLKARGAEIAFDVVSNPEFLKEGDAVADFMKPDRIVIGADAPKAVEIMKELYEGFSRVRDKIILMDVRSAEMTKYAANCMLASRISMVNEFANICELVGADMSCVRQGIGSDPRIGYHFIFPGIGYGGSCFPKDVKALISTAQNRGYEPEMLLAVERVNERQKLLLAQKVLRHFGSDLRGRTIAVWGLAFKPNTDDVREAPAFAFIERITSKGAKVRAYDPKAGANAANHFQDNPLVQIVEAQYQALQGADCLVVCTEWGQFRTPDFEIILRELSQKVIFDGRNIYNPAMMVRLGIRYFGVGREAGPDTPPCSCATD